MNLNVCSMLNHTSGVPFVSSGRWSGVHGPVGSRDRVRDSDRPRGSAGVPPSLSGSFLGRLSENGTHTRGYKVRSNLGSADPAAQARFPSETKCGIAAHPGPQDVVGRNTQPRGPLSKVRSREHVCGIHRPCVNIEPTTYNSGPQTRNLDGWGLEKCPRVRPVSGRSRLVVGLCLLVLLTLGAGRTLGRHRWVEPN
jgi:hypothetical protein